MKLSKDTEVVRPLTTSSKELMSEVRPLSAANGPTVRPRRASGGGAQKSSGGRRTARVVFRPVEKEIARALNARRGTPRVIAEDISEEGSVDHGLGDGEQTEQLVDRDRNQKCCQRGGTEDVQRVTPWKGVARLPARRVVVQWRRGLFIETLNCVAHGHAQIPEGGRMGQTTRPATRLPAAP